MITFLLSSFGVVCLATGNLIAGFALVASAVICGTMEVVAMVAKEGKRS